MAVKKPQIIQPRPNKETDIERTMRIALIAYGIRYQEQARVGRYRPDFLLPDHNIIIECDGPIHETRIQRKKDRKKDLLYKGLGYVVFRFNHRQIMYNVHACIQSLNILKDNPR